MRACATIADTAKRKDVALSTAQTVRPVQNADGSSREDERMSVRDLLARVLSASSRGDGLGVDVNCQRLASPQVRRDCCPRSNSSSATP